MKVLIRADASLTIGSGHIMRCLTLADALRQRGADITFVCREHPGNLIELIENKGYPTARLQPSAEYDAAPDDVAHAAWLGATWLQDSSGTIDAIKGVLPEWLIVDHYAIDHRWEHKLRPHVDRIMVIDDIADRPHDCDLLLDQNLFKNMDIRYNGLVPAHCRNFLGPRYALLRPEFVQAHRNIRKRDGSVRRILIFFGGSDQSNETTRALDAVRQLKRPDVSLDIVVGVTNPHREQIQNLCNTLPNTKYYCQVNNISELMMAADLSIGAGGSTSWERCFLGLPTLIVAIADNQIEPSICLSESGGAWYCGKTGEVTATTLEQRIRHLLNDPSAVVQASTACSSVVDNAGSDKIFRSMTKIQPWEK